MKTLSSTLLSLLMLTLATACSSAQSSDSTTTEDIGACQPNGTAAQTSAGCCSGHIDLRGYCVPESGAAVCSGQGFVEQCTKGLGGPPIAAGHLVCESSCKDGKTTLCLDETASWGCTQDPRTGWGYCAAPDPCTEGTPPPRGRTVATLTASVTSMVGDDRALYVVSGDALLSIDLTQSDATPSVLLRAPSGGFGMVASTLTPAWVGITLNQEGAGKNTTSVEEIPRAGVGAPNIFETIPWATLSLSSDGSHIYANSSANGGSVLTDNGAFPGGLMASKLGSGVGAIATDGSSLYYADYGDLKAAQSVIAVAMPGSSPKVLATTTTAASYVTQLSLSSAGFVVWSECYRLGSTVGAIKQCAVRSLATNAASSPKTYFSAYNITALAVDSASAYWIYNGSIYKAALGGSSAVSFVSNACPSTGDQPTSLVVTGSGLYWSCAHGSIQAAKK